MQELTIKSLEIVGQYNYIDKEALLNGWGNQVFNTEPEYFQAYEFSNGLIFLSGSPDFLFESREKITLDRQIGKFHSFTVNETNQTLKVSDIWLIEKIVSQMENYDNSIPDNYRELIPEASEIFDTLSEEIMRLNAISIKIDPNVDTPYGFCINGAPIDPAKTLLRWSLLPNNAGNHAAFVNIAKL
jgi:hypothetical protein